MSTTLCEEQNRNAKGLIFKGNVARFTDSTLRINQLDLNGGFPRCMFDLTIHNDRIDWTLGT